MEHKRYLAGKVLEKYPEASTLHIVGLKVKDGVEFGTWMSDYESGEIPRGGWNGCREVRVVTVEDLAIHFVNSSSDRSFEDFGSDPEKWDLKAIDAIMQRFLYREVLF